MAGDGGPSGAPEDDPTGMTGLAERNRRRLAAGQARVNELLERYRDQPLVEIALLLYQRDRESAGGVVSSALAFRLFLFQVPLVVLVVGLAGLFGGFFDEGRLAGAGITGSLAVQIKEALSQPNAALWAAIVTGMFGLALAGRTLSRVLAAASCLAWRLPVSAKVSIRSIAAILGLLVTVVVTVGVTNRLRVDHGVAVGSVSLLAVGILYLVAWLAMSMVLPRATQDHGAVLPGAVLVAATMTGLQAVSTLILPGRINSASDLYGAVGLALVALSWYFVGSRTMVLSMALNAVIYERYGRVTRFVFALPGLRLLARHSAPLRRFFSLDDEDPPETQGDPGPLPSDRQGGRA